MDPRPRLSLAPIPRILSTADYASQNVHYLTNTHRSHNSVKHTTGSKSTCPQSTRPDLSNRRMCTLQTLETSFLLGCFSKLSPPGGGGVMPSMLWSSRMWPIRSARLEPTCLSTSFPFRKNKYVGTSVIPNFLTISSVSGFSSPSKRAKAAYPCTTPRKSDHCQTALMDCSMMCFDQTTTQCATDRRRVSSQSLVWAAYKCVIFPDQ